MTYQDSIAKLKKYEKRKGEILKLKKEGMTLQEIGDKMDISKQRVAQIIQNNK